MKTQFPDTTLNNEPILGDSPDMKGSILKVDDEVIQDKSLPELAAAEEKAGSDVDGKVLNDKNRQVKSQEFELKAQSAGDEKNEVNEQQLRTN